MTYEPAIIKCDECGEVKEPHDEMICRSCVDRMCGEEYDRGIQDEVDKLEASKAEEQSD